MRYFVYAAVATTLAATFASPLHAGTIFSSTEIAVDGNRDVDAVSINNAGSIAATLFDAARGTQSGIVLNGYTPTMLPAPYAGSGAAIPAAINAQGDVLGYTYEGIQPHLFLWRGGQYQSNADVALVIEQQAGPPPLPIGLNRHDAVFYTIITGQMNPTDPIYGRFPDVRSMPYLMRYQTAHSLNASAMLAGTTFYDNASSVFVGRGKNFVELLPTQAVTAKGGFVNDSGEVAGSYIDGTNAQHGFTYLNGTYTSFELPEPATPYSVAVTGLNNAGRVVGIYTSKASGTQHGFIFNGHVSSSFGRYGAQDSVNVTLNDHGAILVARQIKQQAGLYRAYRLTCSGSGC